jgi:hypothetical protein
MPTQTTVLQVYSLQAAKATTYYGRPSSMPLRGGAGTGRAVAVFRPDLSKIPRNAVITDAYVDIRLAAAASGTRTMNLQTKPTALSTRPTWGNYGALGPQVATQTRGSLGNGSQFKLPVTATIQAMVKGTQPNNGFRLELADTTAIKIRGTAATGGRPALVVSYVVLPVAPTGLTPSGSAISSARPTLMFAAAADITKLQIQVDPTGNGTAPQFNSGEVAATGGLLDLSDPAWAAFPPLAEGETRLWRARQSNSAGWSPWSGWTTVSRIPTGVLDITQPPGDPDPEDDGILVPVPIDDGTPPVTWTYTPPDGATQTAWRGRLYDAANNVIADSGRTLGPDAEWTPNKGLTRNGQEGVIEVEVWDDTDRVATPGDPVSVIASKPVILTGSNTVDPVDTLVGRVGSWVPDVTLTATRAAVPDFLALVRDGEEIARWAGLDVFDGTTATIVDPAATMNVQHTWQLVPIVNGKKSIGGPTFTGVPRCFGIWLAEVDSYFPSPANPDLVQDPTRRVVLWGGADQEQTQPETAIVHQPLPATLSASGTAAPVVRRRLLRSAPQGALSGTIIYVGDATPTEPLPSPQRVEELLREWTAADSGTRYLLTLGNFTGEVILGDITLVETPVQHPERQLAASMNWWAQ